MSDKKRLVKALVVGCLCGVLTCAIFTGILAAVILSAGLFMLYCAAVARADLRDEAKL